MNLNKKVLLFDLDGTLLTEDKIITKRTLEALEQCRQKGFLLGIATSRSEARCKSYIDQVNPEVLILSGGAVVKYMDEYIYIDAFSDEESYELIHVLREVCGQDCGITMDAVHEHYTNSDIHVGSIRTDFTRIAEPGLKFCVEIHDEETAEVLMSRLSQYDCSKFFGVDWYKITKKTSTKEVGIQKLCEGSDLKIENLIAFGDDDVDSGMLQVCGTGVAMGNSIESVKQIADVVIGSNDEDGIAVYLENMYL